MNLFLLASQRLTRSGQGETDFNYFKLFLETVSGFPSVALYMPGYYVQYPAILQQSLATIFPYLKEMQDHWSGLTQPPHFPAPPKATTPPKPQRPKRPPNALPARMANSISTPTLPIGVPTGQWFFCSRTTTHPYHAHRHRLVHRQKSAPKHGAGGYGKKLQR